MVQDYVHMLISIPPKYSVAEVIGYMYINEKSAIAVGVSLVDAQRTLIKNVYGPEDMLFQQLDLKKHKSKDTYKIRNSLMGMDLMKKAYFNR